MTNTETVHRELGILAEEGMLRALGPAFARFIDSLGDTRAPAPLLLGAALLSELEGRGHSCLDLNDLVPHPCRLLSWPAERWQALGEAAGGWPGSVGEWRSVLAACPQVHLAGDADEQQPLVLDGDRLYLRRYWRDEQQVAAAISARACTERKVDLAAARTWLDRLFGAASDNDGPDWQRIACAIALRSHLSIITGGPGTGKTYTAARLLTLLLALSDAPDRLRIALAAPTGKAATRLKQSIDAALAGLEGRVGDLPLADLTSRMGAARTLHSLLGARPDTRRTRHHRGNPLEVDVLIVDEASMVHLEMMATLLDALPPKAVLVLLGDKDQLASVEAGAVLGDLCAGAEQGQYSQETANFVAHTCGHALPSDMLGGGSAVAQQTVMLRRSRRFSGPIGALAQAVNAGLPAAAREVLRAPAQQQLAWLAPARQADVLDLAINGRPGASGSLAHYLQLLQRAGRRSIANHEEWTRQVLTAFEEFRILCAVREGEWGVAGINQALERKLREDGLLHCRGEWYAGRPVMVTRNDHGLGVYNGDVGVTLPDEARDGALRVYFLAGDTTRSVLATRLPHVDTAFAMTVHKVQGSEFLHAAMVLPPTVSQVVARELVYTGITRAREYFTLVSPEPLVLDEAILRQTSRTSGLRSMLAAEGQ